MSNHKIFKLKRKSTPKTILISHCNYELAIMQECRKMNGELMCQEQTFPMAVTIMYISYAKLETMNAYVHDRQLPR